MQTIPVFTQGNVQFLYDEEDVRRVCSIMRCADLHEDCIPLLRRRAMRCGLCHSVLKLFGKPYKESHLKARLKPTRTQDSARQFFRGE
jgi:hypothetical protein